MSKTRAKRDRLPFYVEVLGEVRYEARFGHMMTEERPDEHGHQLPPRHQVSCALLMGETIVVIGRAVCSSLDTFDFARGCRLAFAHAIRTLPKDQRVHLWVQYFRRYPLPEVRRSVLLTDLERAVIAGYLRRHWQDFNRKPLVDLIRRIDCKADGGRPPRDRRERMTPWRP